MAALLFDNFRQFTSDGGELLAGGFLRMTDPETSLDKTVYADKDLATPLGAEVELDSAARSPTAIWVSGLVNVELLDADEVQVGLCENMGEDLGGISLPDPSDGDENDVLSTDGIAWLLRAILEVPDATGQDGKYLGADDGLPTWLAFPASTTYDEDNLPGSFEQTATSSGGFVFGNIRVQWGTDTAPTASGITTSKAVTFGTAFSSAPWAVLIGTNAQVVTTASTQASASYSTATTTGFTAHFFAGGENAGAGTTSVNSTIPFTYIAVGPK